MLRIRPNIPSMEVRLPIGIEDEGELQKLVTVEAMDGDAEEQISEKKIRNNGAKMITKLLGAKIKKIGDKEYPNGIGENRARKMFSDDRDTCLIAIRMLMNNEMEITQKCGCGNKQDIVVYMDKMLEEVTNWGSNEDLHNPDLPIGVVEFELPDGLLISDDERTNVLCKKGKMLLPNGAIEEKIAQGGLNNAGKANTLLLSACVQEIENIRKVDQYVIKALSRKDREYLADLMNKAKPGPKFIREVECDDCGEEIKFILQLPYFFMSGTGQK